VFFGVRSNHAGVEKKDWDEGVEIGGCENRFSAKDSSLRICWGGGAEHANASPEV